MAEREFKVQVMETDAQWQSGVFSRLDFGAEGLSLFGNPVFDSWLLPETRSNESSDIAVDECGQSYWTELQPTAKAGGRVWKLMRQNPTTRDVEHVLTFSGCGRIEPRELWISRNHLWIFDRFEREKATAEVEVQPRKGRILALARENFQIVYEVNIEKLFDVDLDKQGRLYALVEGDNGQRQICRYSIPESPRNQIECVEGKVWKQPKVSSLGPEGKKKCFTFKTWKEPVALAVGRKELLYVLDRGTGRLIRFDPKNEEETPLGAPRDLLKGFKPSAMEIDVRGVIFLASEYEPAKPSDNEPEKLSVLHMFHEDGSYLGQAELPSSVKKIHGIGFDRNRGIYLATDRGLARFSVTGNPVGQEGLFYSRTLDNGQVEGLWHRIALSGRIPSKTSVEVYYFTSDDSALKAAHDRALAAPSVEEKIKGIDRLLDPIWIGPQTFAGLDFEQSTNANEAQLVSPDLLLNPNKGRFLWLKLKLTTFDRESGPSIRSARIYYHRLSYLRYLPPIYREDPLSAAFLERFLSLFETIFEGLDQEIDQLFRYFDPSLAPKEFLPWLGSWINLSLDDDLPVDRVRRFIRRSPYLYSLKGTPEALIEFLEIYTGQRVFLTEHSRGAKPLVLGGPDFKLGQRTILLGSGPKGMRVGDTTVVGYAAIRDRVSDANEPFLSQARHFTIVFGMDTADFQRKEATLQRIVDEQKPTHTVCTIRPATERAVGNAVLGDNVSITDRQPYRVGFTSLGEGAALASERQYLRLERGAWIGSSKRL